MLTCKASKPGDKPVKRFDSHGLHLLVSTTGHKSWRPKYRIGGKEKQLAFGAYPTVRLTDAREMKERAGAWREGSRASASLWPAMCRSTGWNCPPLPPQKYAAQPDKDNGHQYV